MAKKNDVERKMTLETDLVTEMPKKEDNPVAGRLDQITQRYAEMGHVELSPIQQIGAEVIAVTLGGNPAALRQVILRVFPKTLEEGEIFMEKLLRLKSAGEVAIQEGQRAMAAIQNR
jgi:hypothetical protein